ncbi:MAG: 3-dehydroquinate synthase [Clostridiales bacterium]|nr:3-dehydroquinate synthase [Clostridiales bacterium]
MQDINLNAQSQKSVIHCGAGAFETYAPKIGGKLFLITDSNVYGLYKGLIDSTFGDIPAYVLPAGEKSKNRNNLFKIFDKMIESGVTRSTTVVALGGGVVGDIAGLAASMYMRGIKIVQIPTTLLAQVDSSVGGKTAIDYRAVKNVLGAFYQPAEVIVDPLFLKTLPVRELNCGLGEIIKYSAIDCGIYGTLSQNPHKFYDLNFLEKVTADCIRHKAKVVEEDEKDISGARKTLNLGHTTGHAFELYYKRKSHGEFVLIGMYYELYIAQIKGICNSGYADSLRALIKRVIKNIPAYTDAEQAAKTAKFDKKNDEQSTVSVIVPESEGKSAEIKLPLDEYVRLIGGCAAKLRGEKC